MRSNPIPSARRRLVPVALIAVAAMALAGCGGAEDSPAKGASPSTSPAGSTGCGSFESGKTSDAVTVTGAFGKTQKATFKTPLAGTAVERTVVTKGTGKTTAAGDEVNALLSVYSGKSGASLGSQPTALTVGDTAVLEAFSAGVDCVPLGSRVVVTAPAKDIYGAQGNPQAGISADDTLVIITDVVSPKVLPEPIAWTKDVPTVRFAANGKPKVTLPKSKPPSVLSLKVLKQGTGAVVGKTDKVTVHYQGTVWATGKIFQQTFGGQPAPLAVNQTVPGFQAGLIGQKVGTRLLVGIPPRLGYGAKKVKGQPLAGEFLVFVFEIESTTAS